MVNTNHPLQILPTDLRPIRIGGASGFWGDSSTGPMQLARLGQLDFMVFDYLAELTMSILAAQRTKNPELGYATDFVSVAMRAVMESVAAGQFRVISNAGGMNPAGCAKALTALAQQLGVDLRVAVVVGDDVLAQLPGQGFLTANAYLGALPIKVALDQGAQVVITGRCVDSAVTLGALAHSFQWDISEPKSLPKQAQIQLDLLAQASLAGHILECGCQATGGLLTDWESVPDWANIGYPIVEFYSDGQFVVTKPSSTGGLVNVKSISEQIVYEVHDPASYVLPDVVCDFSQVRLTELGDDQVVVRGARGLPPPDKLKVSATKLSGYRCNAQLTIVGIDADKKAARSALAIFERVGVLLKQAGLAPFTKTAFEVLGGSPLSFEVVLFMVATHNDKRALELFAREIAPAGTSFSPGTTGASGRPAVMPLISQMAVFLPRDQLSISVTLGPKNWAINCSATQPWPINKKLNAANPSGSKTGGSGNTEAQTAEAQTTARLIDIAYGRSGDKGDISNIGIIARSPEALEWIKSELSAVVVANYLKPWVKGITTRYDWPGIGAFNFVCESALDGGGMTSLRNDPLGKGMAQRLLAMPIVVPARLVR